MAVKCEREGVLRIAVVALAFALAHAYYSLWFGAGVSYHRVSAHCSEPQPCPTTPPSAPCPESLPCPAVVQPRDIRSKGKSQDDGKSGHRDFYALALKTGTDKVAGAEKLINKEFSNPESKNPWCKVGNAHFYHTLYQRWLEPWSLDDVDVFQMLEIGFYTGKGFHAFKAFLPRAEAHSMEISCLPLDDSVQYYTKGSGVWPKKWGNFAAKHENYDALRAANRLHCGDASEFDFMDTVWRTHLRRPDAPPLKLVVEDGAHEADQMAAALFFWFPRIEPGGIFVMEDIEPESQPESFRTQLLPQLLNDLHFCGHANGMPEDKERFPTMRPLLHAIHCEMHICVFERNEMPSMPDLSRELSTPPPHALNSQLFKPAVRVI